jgi:hypothetical protein
MVLSKVLLLGSSALLFNPNSFTRFQMGSNMCLLETRCEKTSLDMRSLDRDEICETKLTIQLVVFPLRATDVKPTIVCFHLHYYVAVSRSGLMSFQEILLRHSVPPAAHE